MAISRIHTWAAFETLTAAELNAEFDNFINNGTSAAFPLTGAVSFDGYDVTHAGNITLDAGKALTLAGVFKLGKGATIPSATPDLSAATGNYVQISGTTAITAFGTVVAGTQMLLEFQDIVVLTHNATSLILPGGVNITTAAGDMALVVSEGAGNWRLVDLTRGSGLSVSNVATAGLATGGPITTTGTVTVTGASIAEMVAGVATTTVVTPNVVRNHPGVAKLWANFVCASGVLNASHGVSSVVKNSTGNYTVNFVGLTGAYCVLATADHASNPMFVQVVSQSATSFVLQASLYTGVAADPTNIHVIAYGTL